jgi:hypothetical protein
MFAHVLITESQINTLIGHTLTALRKTSRSGARHKARLALRDLHNAKRCEHEGRRQAAWCYVNSAYWRLRTALVYC